MGVYLTVNVNNLFRKGTHNMQHITKHINERVVSHSYNSWVTPGPHHKTRGTYAAATAAAMAVQQSAGNSNVVRSEKLNRSQVKQTWARNIYATNLVFNNATVMCGRNIPHWEMVRFNGRNYPSNLAQNVPGSLSVHNIGDSNNE